MNVFWEQKTYKPLFLAIFMKKILFGLLLLILITNISALDCQYKDIEIYYEDSEFFYHNGDKFGENLNLTELITFSIGGENNGVITINNGFEVPITMNVTFHEYSTWYGFNNYVTSQITIEPNDHGRLGGTHISSIDKYPFVEPNIITHETVSVEKQREICKICPDGKLCGEDGISCKLDSRCGSGICNIAKVCGSPGSPFVVPCPGELKNCNDEVCLTPLIKKTEEPYSCDWECVPGTSACDGICRSTSAKGVGEEYRCIEECESGRGDGKKCIKSIEDWVYWVIGVSLFVIISILYIYIFIYKRRLKFLKREISRLEKEIDFLNSEINNLILKKSSLEKIIKKREKLIKKRDKEISKLNKEKKILKENIRNADEIGKKNAHEAYLKWNKKFELTKKSQIEERDKLIEDYNKKIVDAREIGKEKAEKEYQKWEKEFEGYRQKSIEEHETQIKVLEEELKNLTEKKKKYNEKIRKAKEIGEKRAVEAFERQIEDLNDEFERMTIKRDKLKKYKDKIEDIKDAKDIVLAELTQKEESFEKEYTKSFKIHGRGGYAWRNPNIPNEYYPCYVNDGVKTDIEIHKDLAKKEIFNQYPKFFRKYYPGKSFRDLTVHHIDKNPDNFDLSNLIIISYNEHKGLHKTIIKGDRESGILALKKRDIKAPHIDELKEE
jgi:hypothetical protein